MYSYRKQLRLFSIFANFFQEYGKLFLFLTAVFLIGFFSGVVNAVKFSSSLKINHITDSVIVGIIQNNAGWLSVFLSRIFTAIFYLVLLYLTSLTSFLLIFNFLIFAYKAYLFGMCVATVWMLFGLSGILTVLLILLPCGLITFFLLIMFNAFFIKNNYFLRKFGRNCLNVGDNAALTFTVCLFLLCTLIESIMLPIIRGVFIIV